MFLGTILKSIPSCNPAVNNYLRRYASILSALSSSPVLVSASNDVYTNLALEHWVYSKLRFETREATKVDPQAVSYEHPIVFIWTDTPSVVIGRHQNPWIETNLSLIDKLGIKLARRHSGGGCVYHDENNINISIIGDRRVFECRQDNLKFLASVLDENYGIKCEPNKRHDLVHSSTGLKMSGSAAKLGRYNSYHHFTLLVDTDKEILQAVIRQKQQDFINTNSTASTRSQVINLNEIDSNLTVDKVISDLTQAYSKRYKNTREDAILSERKVDGSEQDFESLNAIRDDLTKWEWTYGKTPKFKLERRLNLINQSNHFQALFSVHLNSGLFEKFEIDCDLAEVCRSSKEFEHMIGSRFSYKEAMVSVAKILQLSQDEPDLSDVVSCNEKLLATYLLQMIHEAHV